MMCMPMDCRLSLSLGVVVGIIPYSRAVEFCIPYQRRGCDCCCSWLEPFTIPEEITRAAGAGSEGQEIRVAVHQRLPAAERAPLPRPHAVTAAAYSA
jgi:hypothetical protein